MPRFFCSLVLLIPGCNRVPEEPTSHPLPEIVTPDPPSATQSAAALRCIAPLTSAPQPILPAAGERCPPDNQGRFKLARASVRFVEAGVSVDAELARSADENERGLMFRRKMGEEEGMFFFLDERRVQTFWMHNTCIPLDMLFIDDDGVIVGVVEGAPVLDDGPRAVDCPSRFVLEVNAGWVRRHNVKPGQRLVVPG